MMARHRSNHCMHTYIDTNPHLASRLYNSAVVVDDCQANAALVTGSQI